MKRLQKIGMQVNWIYEVIVSTSNAGIPHAAPMGIWSADLETLNMAIYQGSVTLKNILEEKEFAANFVDDVSIYYESLFNKSNIDFRQLTHMNVPVIKDSCATIACTVKDIEEKKNRFHIESEIVDIRIGGDVKLINRAEGLVIESLIQATRLHRLSGPRKGDALKENYRVVRKVAPDSAYQHIMEKVMDLFKLMN